MGEALGDGVAGGRVTDSDAAESGPAPAAFAARTLKVYVEPGLSDDTVHVVLVLLQLCPPGLAVAV